jgi:ferric-dicitrate binding protein FerR (iron transport regulator)
VFVLISFSRASRALWIRVTGTQFNVWMYEDQVKVNLIEGSVLVGSNADQPGDGLRLDPARFTA